MATGRPGEPSTELVAVLCTDIEGSTELRQRVGETTAGEIHGAHRRLLRRRFERFGGREVKSTGDGFLVTFPSPRAAVACAIEIQRALDERNRRFPRRAVHVRIGINVGEVVVEPEDIFGAAVDLAARITAEAGGGQILVSNVVRELVAPAGEVVFEHHAEVELKGFEGSRSLYGVPWESSGPDGPRLIGRTPFVGRSPEVAELGAALDRAASGRGSLVLVAGEPGVGKTRLAEVVVEEARDRGLLAFVGRCSHVGESGTPFGPAVQILASVMRATSPEAFRELLGDEAGEIARIMPELHRLFGDLPPPLEMPPVQERRYLLDSIRRVVLRGAALTPLVLLLDDLHWADGSTLDVVRHVAPELESVGLLLVCTYREPEAQGAQDVARALAELVRYPTSRLIRLDPLGPDDVERMLRSLGGEGIPTGVVRRIREETGGNPFFVEEIFRHLAEEDRLFDQPGIDPGGWEVPKSIRLVLGRRLERLSRDAVRLVESAAVAGREVPLRLLEALATSSPEILLDALDEAEDTGFFVPSDAGPAVAFPHELVRQSVLSEIGGARRRRLHLAVAAALERAFPGQLDERAADLAHHLLQAREEVEPERLANALLLAGIRALDAAAFPEALRAFEQGVDLDVNEELRANLWYRLGQARRSLGLWEGAVEAWERALELYEGLGHVDAVGRLCAGIAQQMAWGARWPEAVGIAMRGLAALEGRPGPERCALLAIAGAVFSLAGDHDGGDRMMSEAMELAEGIRVPGLRGGVQTSRALHHLAYLRLTDAVREGEAAADELRSAGRLWELSDVLGFVLIAHSYLGDFEGARRVHAELEPLASRLGNVGALISVRVWEGFEGLFTTGDLAAWTAASERDLEVRRTAGTPFVAIPHMFLGLGAFWRGDWDDARASFGRAAELEPPGALGGVWVFLALCLAYRGDRDAALGLLDEHGGVPAVDGPLTITQWATLLGAVELFWVLGEDDRAAELYRGVLRGLDAGCVGRPFGDFRLLESLAGLAAAAGGRWDEAEGHFDRAVALARELPIRIEGADARRFHAEALSRRGRGGDADRARALLGSALEDYERFGMARHAALVRERLEELGTN